MRGTLATKDFQVKRDLCCYLIMVSQSHLRCPVCMPPQAKPRSTAPQQMHLTVLCYPGVSQQACSGALCCRAAPSLVLPALSLGRPSKQPQRLPPCLHQTCELHPYCVQRGELVALVPPELVVAVGPRSLDISVSPAPALGNPTPATFPLELGHRLHGAPGAVGPCTALRH